MIYSPNELFKLWGTVALNSFGGPAAQISVIHKLVVEDKKIITEKKFLNALNFCMLLPGPEAQQLATYMGWIMNGWRGGIIAGGLFILPGFISILLLSYIYILFNDVKLIQGIFYGIKPAITVIVILALVRIGKKSLNNKFLFFIAFAAFIALFFFNISFPIVILIAGLLGIIHGQLFNIHIKETKLISRPLLKNSIKTLSLGITLWFLPIFCVAIFWGADSNLHRLNIFFSKMSLTTFGGAYAALSYVSQQAVDVFGWLKNGEMLDGLALAESTPGPLIQVVQYVGFMGGYRFSDGMSPMFSAFLASVLTTWMTFAPCFIFIFTFAPYVEYIQSKKVFFDALNSITAAVVGVIFNLSLWFFINTIFQNFVHINSCFLNFNYPTFDSVDYYGLVILIISSFMQVKLKISLLPTLGVAIILGLLKFFI